MDDTIDALNNLSVSRDVLVVNSIDTLNKCKAAFKSETVLAWDCEGVEICRFGQITVVQLATRKTCFLLDFLAPEPARAKIVLFAKAILEDDKVVKIIHDPAADSDGLFHKHGIKVSGIHDTQSWYMVIKKTENRMNLNATLEAFGCETNDVRDSDIYRTNPSFWATRPFTTQMTEWASGDVVYLFELYKKQRQVATQSQKDAASAKTDLRVGQMRDAMVQEIQVHRTQVGNFIGKGGSNIRFLETELGVVFHCKNRQKRDGKFLIYSPDEKTHEKAKNAVQAYTRAWRRNAYY